MHFVLIAESNLPTLGQFLVPLSAFFNWFNLLGILSVGVMWATLHWLYKNYARKLWPDLSESAMKMSLGVGGVVSIMLTFLLTGTSFMFLVTVLSITSSPINSSVAMVAEIDQSEVEKDRSRNGVAGHVARHGFNAVTKSRVGKYLSLITGVLLVVGAGYAYTLLELPFLESFMAMSAGVGFPEELTKIAAGLLVLYYIFDVKELTPKQFYPKVLVAFGLAGLGFGAVEALKYFGAYAEAGEGLVSHLLRAVFCVTLHGSWTLTSGAILSSFLTPQVEQLQRDKLDTAYRVCLAAIPSALCHGLYNTLAFRNSALCFVVGAVSIYIAHLICQSALGSGGERNVAGEQSADAVQPAG